VEDIEIKERIESFPRWHYQFDLKGNLTPIFDPLNINRHLQRRGYFFEPLIRHLGGSLKGKRVLDLGCNAGFWALSAIEAGCDYVLGIDGRQTHIDQANFVFEVNGIDHSRYSFTSGDIFGLDFKEFGKFDIVLCLGLLYHVNKHILLMEKIDEVSEDILVIDTTLSTAQGSFLELRHEQRSDPRNALDYDLVMLPTKRAIFEMVELFGYSVIMLKPEFTDYTGATDFKNGVRRAFICSKRTSLSAFPSQIESLE
jgi:tRNA (mo5U34)-methyltransferase